MFCNVILTKLFFKKSESFLSEHYYERSIHVLIFDREVLIDTKSLEFDILSNVKSYEF